VALAYLARLSAIAGRHGTGVPYCVVRCLSEVTYSRLVSLDRRGFYFALKVLGCGNWATSEIYAPAWRMHCSSARARWRGFLLTRQAGRNGLPWRHVEPIERRIAPSRTQKSLPVPK
jgi:hypothetical protein